jgi:hypothetical protein
MRTRLSLVIALSVLNAWLLTTAAPLQAALYWFQGVRAKNISVCFVGDAVTSRPARLRQVLDYIQHFQYAANILFNYAGTCPAPTRLAGKQLHHSAPKCGPARPQPTQETLGSQWSIWWSHQERPSLVLLDRPISRESQVGCRHMAQ